MAKDKTYEFYAARVDAAARVRSRARDLGASDEIAELIGAAQLWRGSRARNNDASRAAGGIRIADRDRSRVKDAKARSQDRASSANARHDRDLLAYRRSLAHIAGIERALSRASGKLRRELKGQLRAARYQHDLTYGHLARLDRRSMVSDAIDPAIRREIAGLIWEDSPSRAIDLSSRTDRDPRPIVNGIRVSWRDYRNMIAFDVLISTLR